MLPPSPTLLVSADPTSASLPRPMSPVLALPPIRSLPPLDEASAGHLATIQPFLDVSDCDPRAPSRGPPSPPASAQMPAMPHEQARDAQTPRAHARRRSSRGSVDLTKPRGDGKPPSQKAMLSRALEKANAAVELDRAQNFQGARPAYYEACKLLQQVLQRTAADEDKRKLDAIRRTYASRIDELNQIGGPWDDLDDKALPSPPANLEYQPSSGLDQGRIEDQVPAISSHGSRPRQSRPSSQPRQQDERLAQNGGIRLAQNGTQESSRPSGASQNAPLHSIFSRPVARLRPGDEGQVDTAHLPLPVTTIRPLSPSKPQNYAMGDASAQEGSFSTGSWEEVNETTGHVRDGSQNSWLDPIDESAGFPRSSVNSQSSSYAHRWRHRRQISGNTESEFDTALDAAIEAAYDDGYEPTDADGFNQSEADEEVVTRALRKVEIARERVRQTEREAYKDELQRRQQQQQQYSTHQEAPVGFYNDDSSEEEERMLDEMVRDYGLEDAAPNRERKASVSSRPESRGRSVGAWQSPVETSFAMESMPFPQISGKTGPRRAVSKTLRPSAPPPTQSLPELPAQRSTSSQSVRSRRLSGQNAKQLVIDTSERRPPPPPTTANFEELLASHKASPAVDQHSVAQPGEAARMAATPKRRISPRTAELKSSEPMFLESPPNGKGLVEGDELVGRRSGSPSTRRLRKNFSSSSLRSIKGRTVTLSNADDVPDMSPGTPSSSNLQPGSAKAAAVPALPTPLAAAFRDHSEGSATGGLHLFEDGFHLPGSPSAPTPTSLDAPVPLEPCPNDFLLRPFWLMRCLYQTLAHPRGGYLSTKLFVPRDVWKVKGVKLKSVEDKIACCDYITSRLQKLAKADTCDADAVLDEMEGLEVVLEQVQATLTRKLGNEVGVQSSGILFKEASNVVDADGAPGMPRAVSVSSKSSFSWRRLRSKNSAMGLAGAYNNSKQDGPKEHATMPTLPMTPQVMSRPAKRDVGQAQFSGPNAHYMGALARLFDAAQAVDQIARQVDDPGLRHADKTQVGLELCTRRVAEFFAFYICRFVLTDLGLLLDKFIKRGSEWVLA